MELRNYRKFRDARIEFPDGVVAIVGNNGTGKTTILEAVTWALFGNSSSVVRDNKREWSALERHRARNARWCWSSTWARTCIDWPGT